MSVQHYVFITCDQCRKELKLIGSKYKAILSEYKWITNGSFNYCSEVCANGYVCKTHGKQNNHFCNQCANDNLRDNKI